MFITSVMPSNHLIFYRPLLLLPSIFPSIRVFSKESVLRNRWPKYWSFSFSISPPNEYSGLISFRINSDLAVRKQTAIFENGPKPKQRPHQRRCTNGKQAYVIREIEMQTTTRYHHTSIRMAKICNTANTKCWLGRGTTETPPIIFGDNVKWCSHFKRQFGSFLQN